MAQAITLLECYFGSPHGHIAERVLSMVQPISKFFEGLQLPLRNVRWSWGAMRGKTLLLRTWSDEFYAKEKTVTVLREPARYQKSESFGLDERIVHLKGLWQGGIAGYTVIANVKDPNVHPREIRDYRDDVVFSIKKIRATEGGALIAELGELVPLSNFSVHSATHTTQAGEGPYPVDDSQRSGLSTDSYAEKIPAIRNWLVDVCDSRGTVTYSEVMDRFGLTFYPLRNAMAKLGHDCKRSGEPILTALIVDKETGRCSQGLFDEFHIEDDQLERDKCYAYWAKKPVEPESNGHPPTQVERADSEELAVTAARFAQVEIRPQQRAFRDLVFKACGGRCIVSGCDVPEALEAAHLKGTSWRQGHNRATDGILLRRDLHALYDRELLQISDTGVVSIDPRIATYYKEFDGIQLSNPMPSAE